MNLGKRKETLLLRDENEVGSVSEGTDFGQKKNLNQQVYWFMV